MRKGGIVLAFLSLHVLFFLNSCKIYDHYQKVDVQSVVSSYDKLVQSGEELQPEDLLQSLSLPDDASLQQLIDSALVHNTDLRIAQTRIDAAAARLRQTKLAFLPDLQLGVQGGGSFSPNANPSWSHSELFSASWEIEFTNLGTIIGYNSNTYEVNDDYKNFCRLVTGTISDLNKKRRRGQ